MKIRNEITINYIINGHSQIILAYAAWGLLPIYWKLFHDYNPATVIAHRLVWSAIFCAVVLGFKGELKSATRILLDKKRIAPLIISSVLIAVNWLSYIYALSQGKALEAALAYFICPLLSILFGALFLGEQIQKRNILPLILIAIGVGVRVFEANAFPILALIIGGSFSLYALNKKRIKVEATAGMYAETLILAIPAGIYLLLSSSLQNLSANDAFLFATTGAVTVIPLILFSAALATVSMRFVGLAQYLAPTLMFLVAIIGYGEPISIEILLSFLFIWSGIALSVMGDVQISRKRNLKLPSEAMLSNA